VNNNENYLTSGDGVGDVGNNNNNNNDKIRNKPRK
jgi:hypothetical protein